MGRKQSQSAESVWRDRLARFRKSKLSVTEFCRHEGVSDPSFYQWRKRLRKDDSKRKPGRRSGSRKADTAQPFVPIKVSASSAVSEIEFPNGVRIRVPANNAEALRAALQVGHELCREAI